MATYYVTDAAGGGGVGSEGDPFTLEEARTTASAGDIVYVQNDGTYTIVGDFATPSGNDSDPIVWIGYSSVITDGYQGRSVDGTLDTSNMPDIVMSGSGVNFVVQASNIWQSFQFSSSDVGAGHPIRFNSADSALLSCAISHTGSGGSGASALLFQAAFCAAIDCDVTCTATTAAAAIDVTSGQTRVIGCRVTCTNGDGIQMAGDGTIAGCLIYECGGDGIVMDGDSARLTIVYCTIVDCTDGIATDNVNLDDLRVYACNLITDNSSYGIDSAYATGLPQCLYLNRFDRNTSGATNSLGTWPNLQAETTSATEGQEYTDASTDDYSLASTSPAIDVGTLPNMNIGAWQHAASAGGGAPGHSNMTGGLLC